MEKTNDYGKIFHELLGSQYNENAYSLMHYSVLNFSFMPVTGGLNLNKANGKYCDRLDRLIFYLDKFIRNKKLDMTNPLMRVRGRNRKTVLKLAEYIASFNSIEEYCQVYYLIDSNETTLVYEFIDLGKEYVIKGPSVENCKKYLNLVAKFWKYRNKVYKEKYGIDVCCLDDGINIFKLEL